jgi:hypothetical protein
MKAMKATQIRITLGLAAVFGLGVLAVAPGLGGHAAYADAVSPGGPFTAALCSGTRATFRLGTATVSCTVSSTSGTATTSASGQPICGNITAPTLSGCTVNAGFFSFGASCTTSGTWNLCASSSGAANLTIPQNGVSCTASVVGQTCRANSTTTAAATISGSWSNTSSSATFTNQGVSVVTSGGFPCPSATSAVFSAQFCTSPALTISPN